MPVLPLLLLAACNPTPDVVDADSDGFVSTDDCDDASASVFPGGEEVCDGQDNDCDGEIDETPTDGARWYTDADGDDFGDPLSSRRACTPADDEVADATDCDDEVATVFPGAEEICDGLDNDCDNIVDEDIDETLTFYADADGDGYGDPDTAILGCTPTSGMVDNDDDCDDSDVLTSPGAAETWYDGHDADCAGDNDFDADADGFDGDGGVDCDDTNPATNPGATEICSDGIDNDCDGGAGACSISGTIAAADADATFTGSSGQSYAGFAIDGAGDTNGDGVNEILIGAYGTNGFAGEAYIASGSDTGTLSLSTDAIAILSGPSGYSYTGYSVAGAGDVDGDGFDDVLVGTSYRDTAYLAYGPLSGSLDLDETGWTFGDGASSGYATLTVTGLGDIDGDGLADVAIGFPYNSSGGNGSGATFIALGGGKLSAGGGELDADDAEAMIYGRQNQYSSYSLDGAGDVNGDGLDDVLVGTGSQSEQAYIFHGPVTGELDILDADVQLTGTNSSYAGHAVSTAGDTNGDGYDDVIIGGYYDNSGSGSAHLFRGPLTANRTFPTADAQMTGESTFSYAGYSVSDAGDIDGDGSSDLLVGAPYASNSSGKAYLVSGTISGTVNLVDAAAIITGGPGYSWMGAALAGPGDVNGDGYDDLLIGAPYASAYAGSVSLFRGGGL